MGSKIDDYLAPSLADGVRDRFAIQFRAALHDADHELHFVATSFPDTNPNVVFRYLVSARADEAHKLYPIAVNYVSAAIARRLNEDFSLIESRGSARLLDDATPSECIAIATSIRDRENGRFSQIQSERAKKKRPGRQSNPRQQTIADMAAKRIRAPELSFAEWLNDVCKQNGYGELEITPLHNAKDEYEIFYNDTTVTVQRSTMANDWWVKAKPRAEKKL